jgi:hypothetical protein
MLLTVEEILNIRVALDSVGKLELPIKLSWKIAKNLSLCNEVFSRFEKQKNEIIIKHGEPGDTEGSFKVKDGEMNNVLALLNEIASVQEEINLTRLAIEEFGTELKIAPNDLARIAKIVA